MAKLVECIPDFSEGKNKEVLGKLETWLYFVHAIIMPSS